MSDAMDLARRAVACRRWTLTAPIDDPRGGYASVARVGGALWRWVDQDRTAWRKPNPGELPPMWLPDLTDPATLGCIEHGILAPLGIYIERAFRDNSYGIADLEFTIMRGVVGDGRRGRWVGAEAESDIVHPRPGALCVTLQDALVAALEAAP